MRGAWAGAIIPCVSDHPLGSGRKGYRVRAMDCDYGQHLEAADDEQLFEQAREYVDRDHPEMEISDEQIRNLITERAYNPKLFRE